MRKSKSRLTTRLAMAAGLTTGVVGAALLVAPTAAFAVVAVDRPIVPVNGLVTITDTGATFSVGGPGTAASRVQVLTAAPATGACAASMPVVSPTILASDITTGGNLNESTANTVKFRMPAAAVANANGQAKRYVACVYDTDSTAREGSANGYPVWVGTPPTLSAGFGPSGGGNNVGFTTSTPVFTGITTVGSQFTTAVECPSTLGTPGTGLSGTVNRIGDSSVSVTVPTAVTTATTGPTPYLMCLYNGTGTSAVLISAAEYTVAPITLSQYTGPWGGLNGLNITGATDLFAGMDTVGVVFRVASCGSTYSTATTPGTIMTVALSDVRTLGAARVALTVPALHSTAPGSATDWNVCLYNGTVDASSPLIATIPYTATTVHAASGITPRAGSALGGSRIVITGAAFPTTAGQITATLGGTPLLNITPISATAFSAVTPAHTPANNVALVVTTSAGQHTLPNAYSYTAALKVEPNTAPNTRAIPVIIRGVGFQSSPFQSPGDLQVGAQFYLVEGTYSSADLGGGDGRANPPVTTCNNVLVMSDTEAICTLNLHRRLDVTGEAQIAAYVPAAAVAMADLRTSLGSRIITATSDVFTKEREGMILAETSNVSIPAGTTIVDVLGPRIAVMSAAAITTDNDGFSAAWQTPVHRPSVTMTTTANANVTAAVGTFTQADVGKVPVGSNFTAGTYILSVGADGGSVVLSANAASAGLTTVPLYHRYAPVPDGAYNLTYVSSGATGAVVSDPNYVQSQVSSGSTFTVSSF